MLLDFKLFKLVGIAFIALVSFSGFADKIHDPTLPKVKVDVGNNASQVSQETKQGAVLQGIVNKRNSRMAIISGQLTKVGDEVDGYRVSQINKNNVVLIKAGSQKRLYVYEK